MKAFVILIPAVALLVSACAPEPVHRRYYGNGGTEYYGPDTVYVEGRDYDHRGNYDHRNENDVTVNRTNINERTVNRTNVSETNARNGGQAHKHGNAQNAEKKTRKTVPKEENANQGNQQSPPRQ